MKYRFLLPLLGVFLLFSCVKKKVYHAELTARKTSEARESVLLRQNLERKKEVETLVRQVGDLNREIGEKDEQIKNLQLEVVAKSRQFGDASGRLSIQNQELEAQLRQLTDSLFRIENTLRKIEKAQTKRQEILTQLFTALSDTMTDWKSAGVELEMLDESVLLTLPDPYLFEPNGLTISSIGRSLGTPVADFIVNRPDLEIEIQAHTDNTLPKDKSVKDSWDWSILRATNLARLLVRDFNVNANQLTPVAKGEFDPVASNEEADGRAKNRRVVLVFKPVLPPLPGF